MCIRDGGRKTMLLRSRMRFIPICIIIMMIFSACSSNSEEGSEQTALRPAEEITQDQDIDVDEDKDITEPEEPEPSWDWSVQQPRGIEYHGADYVSLSNGILIRMFSISGIFLTVSMHIG